MMIHFPSLLLFISLQKTKRRMSLPFFFTKKYLRSKKDSRFLSVISYITILGISLGVAVVIIALQPKIKSNIIIKYMAQYSLALYCLHQFLMGPIKSLVAKITQNNIVLIYGSIILVILLSYILAMVLKTYLKDEVIT